MEIITLSNNKKVANFSSAHTFEFEDGSVIPAHTEENSKRLEIIYVEIPQHSGIAGDTLLEFMVSDAVLEEMKIWYSLWLNTEVDVVFCPLPMIMCLRKTKYDLKDSPFRTIRRLERNSNICSISKQCL